MTLRLADHDWLTAHTDAPANTRWEGLIDPGGGTITAQLGGGDRPRHTTPSGDHVELLVLEVK